MASSTLHSSSNTSTLGSTRGQFVCILTSNQFWHLCTMENMISLRVLIECFQLSMDLSGELCSFSPALVPVVLSMFLAELITGNFRLLIHVASCCIEAPWLHLILKMLENVHWQCPMLKDFIEDVMLLVFYTITKMWLLTLLY